MKCTENSPIHERNKVYVKCDAPATRENILEAVMSTDMRSVVKAKMAAMDDDLGCGFVADLPGPDNVDYEYDEVYELPEPSQSLPGPEADGEDIVDYDYDDVYELPGPTGAPPPPPPPPPPT